MDILDAHKPYKLFFNYTSISALKECLDNDPDALRGV